MSVADAVIAAFFDSVSDRVPEVEKLSVAAFTLVIFDDCALHFHCLGCELRQEIYTFL